MVKKKRGVKALRFNFSDSTIPQICDIRFFDAEFDFDFVIEVLYFGAFDIFLLSEKEVLF